jgi:hypothetical protein
MLEVVFGRRLSIWVELRDKRRPLVDAMAYHALNDSRLETLPLAMGATAASA